MFSIIFRGMIKGSPRIIAFVGVILVTFGLCPVALLAGEENILNALSLAFYSVALFAFTLALFKYLIWRRSGLLQHMPVLQLDHVDQKENTCASSAGCT